MSKGATTTTQPDACIRRLEASIPSRVLFHAVVDYDRDRVPTAA